MGPALFGALHALTNNWTVSLIVLIVSMSLQALFGAFAGRDRYVLEPKG